MTAHEVFGLYLLPVFAGVCLAAAAGLRAFLPLAAVAWGAWLEWIPLNESFAWLGSPVAVTAFTAAVVIEILGDKFPAVDHALDALATVVKPVAATILVAASFTELDPLYAVIAGLVGGATIATGVHVVKAKGRLLSNLLTFGFAAPILSVLEDLLAVLLIAAALLLPLAGLVLIAVVAFFILRRRARVAAA